MARSISEEELQLKKRARRRLVGAVVLVTAIAVILPMVLDSEPQPVSQSVDIHIPSPDAGEFKPQSPSAKAAEKRAAAVPQKTDQASGPATADVAQRDESPEAQADARAVTEERTAPAAAVSEKGGAPSAKDPVKPAAGESAPASAAAYVVQVAALSDAGKAKQLQRQVAATGVKAYTEVVAAQSGVVTRVRAGPYATREAAEQARERLRKAGFEGRVVSR